jgi:hypothetical protein
MTDNCDTDSYHGILLNDCLNLNGIDITITPESGGLTWCLTGCVIWPGIYTGLAAPLGGYILGY